MLYNENGHDKPDYYFSDSNDIQRLGMANVLCLLASCDDEKCFREYKKRLTEHRNKSLVLVEFFFSWSVNELSEVFDELTEKELQFRYDVVGGNPRNMSGSMDWCMPCTVLAFVVRFYFGDEYTSLYDESAEEYNSLTDNQRFGVWAVATVGSELRLQEADAVRKVKHNFFMKYERNE